MKKVLLFILSAFAVFMLPGCDDSSDDKPFVAEAPSSKALTPNNMATVTNESEFPILWRVDGKADDVLVFVKKDGKVIGKVKEYYISSKNQTPVFSIISQQNDKLILLTTVGNLKSNAAYDLMDSKIVNAGNNIEIKKDDIINNAADVISFTELIQGFAVYMEYEDNRWFDFNKRLFNDINASVKVNSPVFYENSIEINNISSLEISASVPSEDDVTEDAVEQNGMKYAMYAGRVIEYPKLNNNQIIKETMPVKFNTQKASANYTAQAYNKQENPATLSGEIKHISSTKITVNITNLNAVKESGFVSVQLGEESSSPSHKIRVKGYYLTKK